MATCEVSVTVNSVVARWSAAFSSAPADGRVTASASLELIPGKRGDKKQLLQNEQSCQVAEVDNVSKVSGVTRFHFLQPGSNYQLMLNVGTGQALVRKVATESRGRAVPAMLSYCWPAQMWRTYVGEEHDLGDWLSECPDEFVWVFKPSFELLRSLWVNACFSLPSPSSPITQCPNPSARYCLDLTRCNRWLHGKKVRRHKSDFRLTVNSDFKATFARCAALHVERKQGVWITPALIDALERCRLEFGELRIYSIELWDKKTGELAAAIMSLSLGDIFHDYTMATMLRDSRSPGAILTKVVGHLLVQCGFTLWYWGFKNEYMKEYDSSYGGSVFDSREDFWPRWKAAQSPDAARPDLASIVPPGESLDLADL
mmetsp:Transcript_65352/g.142424  ORF Transcript_65352/g.142424 Transcript_65352/m.142424 type:complete len:372 (+) Transcript_65352:41-1156(+)